MPARKRPSRPHVLERTRTAYHEAGHAVLSSAINDTPNHVSIRSNGETLGRCAQRMFARPTSLVQVHLAGFAAEHLLTRRRPRQLDLEIGFAILASSHRTLRDDFRELRESDGSRALDELRKLALYTDDDARRELERFYDVARESLSSVWMETITTKRGFAIMPSAGLRGLRPS